MNGQLFAACSAVAVGAVVVSIGATDAAWTDAEWVAAQIGVVDCDDAGIYASRGEGRFVAGDALGSALGQVVDVPGVVVVNDGIGSTASGGVPLGDDTYVNPLTAEVLSPIGVDLTSLLVLPLDAETGIVNQYARAASDGASAGASGLVDESGAVLVSAEPTGSQLPGWVTVRLSQVVAQLTGQAVGDLVAGLTDLSLELGAIAARARLDACSADYQDTLTDTLERDYAIAGLDARVETPLVGGLTGAAAAAIAATNALVTGVAGSQGVVDEITSGVSGLIGGVLGGVLGTLQLGTVAVTGLAIDADLSQATALLTGTIADEGGLVEVDLGEGTVTVDLAAVLGATYGGTDGTLNGLPANTELLVDDAVLATVTGALTAALEDWVEDVLAALTAALLAAEVGLTVTITLVALGSPVATVTAVIGGASLSSLLDGSATVGVTTSVALIDALCANLLTAALFCPLRATVNTVLDGVTGVLQTGLGPLVGQILAAVLLEEVEPGEYRPKIALAPLDTAVAALVGVVGSTLGGFLGEGGLASLMVNVQNEPQAGGPAPGDWAALPAGRYAIGALRIGVLGGLDAHLDLATASVGANSRLSG